MGAGKSVPRVQLTKERIVIVTGANAGLGYEIAKRTAMMGATVIMACRSEERARKAIQQMNSEFREERAKGTPGLTDGQELELKFMQLDCASYKSVIQFVENFKKSYNQLHVLFCNAGVAFGPYNRGRFILAAKLLPVMKKSGPDCRLLMMSSSGHALGTFEIDNINYTGRPDKYPKMDYYGRSKLYQLMQMYSMVRRLKSSNVTVNCVHPGVVDTEIARDATSCFLQCMICCAKSCGIAKTPERAAKCSIDCVVNPKLAGVAGVYFVDFDRVTPNSQARNENDQELLWKKTFEFVGQYLTEEEKSAMEGRA